MKTNADTRNVTKRKARELLDSYLKGTGHRHTPERSAILDAVYDQRGHFTLDELAKVLEQPATPAATTSTRSAPSVEAYARWPPWKWPRPWTNCVSTAFARRGSRSISMASAHAASSASPASRKKRKQENKKKLDKNIYENR